MPNTPEMKAVTKTEMMRMRMLTASGPARGRTPIEIAEHNGSV